MTKALELSVITIEERTSQACEKFQKMLADRAFDYDLNVYSKNMYTKCAIKLFMTGEEKNIDKFVKDNHLLDYEF